MLRLPCFASSHIHISCLPTSALLPLCCKLTLQALPLCPSDCPSHPNSIACLSTVGSAVVDSVIQQDIWKLVLDNPDAYDSYSMVDVDPSPQVGVLGFKPSGP